MTHTVHLSNGTQYAARLEIWDDLTPQTRGPWFALYWANPGESTGVRATDNYLSFRTVRAAREYGIRHFGETAARFIR